MSIMFVIGITIVIKITNSSLMYRWGKDDFRNKKSFIIILVLFIAIVSVFSLFIYKYSKASKIEYLIEAGSVIQDIDKNYLSIDADATLKIRWNGNYYLVYNEDYGIVILETYGATYDHFGKELTVAEQAFKEYIISLLKKDYF